MGLCSGSDGNVTFVPPTIDTVVGSNSDERNSDVDDSDDCVCSDTQLNIFDNSSDAVDDDLCFVAMSVPHI